MADAVVISYKELLEHDLDFLAPRIEQAFDSSPAALGFLLIKDLPPEFPELRRRALLAANRFASLPEHTQKRFENADAKYSIGWSHGREMHNGKSDTLKASYYYNPKTDEPDVPAADRERYVSSYAPNVWPSEEECPDFARSQADISPLLVDVGVRVARACDGLIESKRRVGTSASVARLIGKSQACKARLLHYFPPPGQVHDLDSSPKANEREPDDSWCGSHKDHGALTVLLSNMYLFHPDSSDALDPLPIPPPSDSAGLYIKTRDGRTVQANIPEDCIAVQTGETLELLSSSALAATPHFVYGGSGTLSESTRSFIQSHVEKDESWSHVARGTVTRETLAVFFQPDVHDVVGAETGETFGEWTERVLNLHYSSK